MHGCIFPGLAFQAACLWLWLLRCMHVVTQRMGTRVPAPGRDSASCTPGEKSGCWGKPLSESQPCPRVTQLRGHNPLLFCLFFLSHFPGEPIIPQKTTEDTKLTHVIQSLGCSGGCRASIALGSRYAMSPWWPTKALWESWLYKALWEMQGPVSPQFGHTIPSLELAKGTSLCHFYWPLYTGSHLAELRL